MIKKALIVAGLLGMGLAAGFVVFVFNAEDESLLASQDDDNCPWAYSSGTLELDYRWGSGVGSGSAWREAFENAVDDWNDLDTNVWVDHDTYSRSSFNSYNHQNGWYGFNTPYCYGGTDGYRAYNDTWGNRYYSLTVSERRAIADHEVGPRNWTVS